MNADELQAELPRGGLTQQEIDAICAATDRAYAEAQSPKAGPGPLSEEEIESLLRNISDPSDSGRSPGIVEQWRESELFSSDEIESLLEDIAGPPVKERDSTPDRHVTFQYSDESGSLLLRLDVGGHYTTLHSRARDRVGIFAGRLFAEMVKEFESSRRENRAAGKPGEI